MDDPGYSSAVNAIQACPQPQAVCGDKQFIYFNASESNTTTLTISSGLTEGASCTYWITSDCFAPGFTFTAANTLTSAEALVMVTEWETDQITASTWYPKWPMRDTDYSEIDDQTGFVGGQLPYRTKVMQAEVLAAAAVVAADAVPASEGVEAVPAVEAADAIIGTPEMNRTISGETINDLMSAKTAENLAYYAAYDLYNRMKNEWNASLRIGNSLFDFAESFAFLAPADEADLVYATPTRPDMPYQPKDYIQATFADTTPQWGYGSASESMYVLEDYANMATPALKYKNFGVLGTSADNNLGVRDNQPTDGVCRNSTIAVTILPVVGFTQSSEVLEIQFGQYEWRGINQTTPMQPPAPTAPLPKDWNQTLRQFFFGDAQLTNTAATSMTNGSF